jgi:hypothetical protein
VCFCALVCCRIFALNMTTMNQTVYAGANFMEGNADGPVSSAQISVGPNTAMAVHPTTGDLYLVSSSAGSCTVRRIFTNTTDRYVETLSGMAGCGTAVSGPVSFSDAMFSPGLTCASLTPDYTGLLVCDSSNQVVRLLNFTTQNVSIVAGVAGTPGDGSGPVTSAMLANPTGVSTTPWGDTYILLSGSQNIKRVRAGSVTTVAGTPGPMPVDGPALSATLGTGLRGLYGLPGRLWFLDGNTIRAFSYPSNMPPMPPAPPATPMPPTPGPPAPPFGKCEPSSLNETLGLYGLLARTVRCA